MGSFTEKVIFHQYLGAPDMTLYELFETYASRKELEGALYQLNLPIKGTNKEMLDELFQRTSKLSTKEILNFLSFETLEKFGRDKGLVFKPSISKDGLIDVIMAEPLLVQNPSGAQGPEMVKDYPNYGAKPSLTSSLSTLASNSLKLFPRIFEFLYCKAFQKGTFEFRGETYDYYLHFYPITFRNERAVEIPISLKFIKGNCLEVGNVLHSYKPFDHDVVDKYEKGAINADIVDYHPQKKYDSIVCISTLEHIGWDEEKEKNKALRAVESMKGLLVDGGSMGVTYPFGYNSDLDALTLDNELGFTECYFLKRISKYRWKQTDLKDIRKSRYGAPYPCANALVVGIYVKPEKSVKPSN